MKVRWTLMLALLLICAGTGAALAQTPDGEPPSEETVCDGESGAAYGLCNAYCEAMDCESEEPAASATACGKVRTKFENITGRDVPCEQSSCPCASIPFYNTVLAEANYCYEAPGSYIVLSVFAADEEFNPPYDVAYADSSRCISDPIFGSFIVLPVTPEESAACVQLEREAAASLGLTCRPLPHPYP